MFIQKNTISVRENINRRVWSVYKHRFASSDRKSTAVTQILSDVIFSGSSHPRAKWLKEKSPNKLRKWISESVWLAPGRVEVVCCRDIDKKLIIWRCANVGHGVELMTMMKLFSVLAGSTMQLAPMGVPSLEPVLRRFFQRYGYFCYTYRWTLVTLSLIIIPILSAGFYRLNELRVDDPAYVFTPKEARWRHELNVFSTLWPLNENKFLPGKSFKNKRFVNILIKSKDGGNVLRPEVLSEIEVLNSWIMNNITVSTADRKYNLTYQDLCLNYDWVCGGNEHIAMFQQMSKVGRVIDLTYPKGGNQDTPAYLGTTLGDITLNETDHTVQEAKITQIFFFLKQEEETIRQYSADFSYAVEKFLLHVFESELIEVSFAHYQSLEDGLDENANRFVPNFVFSFSSLSIFAIVCSFAFRRVSSSRFGQIDWVRSKPYVACCGLFTTLLAISGAFGMMMFLGVPYNVINTIIPFLIIAIGIDDMFIMNACWEQTDKSLSVPDRMSDMMAHAGVAVSITNITDVLSFAIGCITDLPGIQFFCSYACAAVAVCYILQLTFFAGFMAIMGDIEHERRHCLFLTKVDRKPVKTQKVVDVSKCDSPQVYPENFKQFQVCKNDAAQLQPEELQMKSVQKIFIDDEEELKKETIKTETTSNEIIYSGPGADLENKMQLEKENAEAVHEDGVIQKFFTYTYGPFLLKNWVRVLVCVLYVGYMAVAIVGCVNFREGLNPGNLVTNDHYIARYFEDLKKFWAQGPQLHVAVLQPPNFTDPVQREQMMAVVRAFEDTEYTLGRRGTVFFFLEYLNYLDDLNVELENTEKLWNKKLNSWLKYTGASNQWKTDMFYNETTHELEAFRFQIAMKNIVEPNDHKHATKMLRDIADAQPFHIEIYYEAFPFADQYLIILPATLQNVLISLGCMTAISIFLVPSLPSAILILISIISINIGVFGYMTHWGVNLDAVSMISIIMSIGFAVDLSAHIVYAFVTSHGDTHERVVGALEHLGWPIFQGATSTITGISILYTVDAYIILTFFKTIWLTMFLGMVHGLIFIPTMLSFIPISFFHIPKEVQTH
uniref:SSD domain-containing protein n=1 Tax=Steinernema glaseri TaxID=37863 RepID=A0A1I7Z7R4_9BILA